MISDGIVLDQRLKELETWFANCGYNSEKIRLETERVKTMNRTDLLSKRRNEIDNTTVLVQIYYPTLAKVYYENHTDIGSSLNV